MTKVFDIRITNACKGLAVLMLLWHHLASHWSNAGMIVQLFGEYGKLCVAIFVLLSGFGLVRSSHQGIRGQNFRIFRLYVNFWVVAIVFIGLSWIFWGRSVYVIFPDNRPWAHVAAELLGLRTYCSINPTWWFIKPLLILYLFYPILYWLMNRHWCLPVFFALISIFFLRQNPGIWILSFVLGMFLAKFNVFEKCAVLRMGHICCLIAALLSLLLSRHFLNLSWAGGRIEDGFIAALLIFTLFKLCIKNDFFATAFGWCGRHSLNVFLLHIFIYKFFFPDFFTKGDGGGAFLMRFFVLLFASLACSVAIEFIKQRCYVGKLISFADRQSKTLFAVNDNI